MLPIEIEEKIEMIRAEIGKFNAELLDVTVRRSSGRGTLTLVVDKDGGISMDDCATINKHLGEWLDRAALEKNSGFFASPYTLEVNSPGLDRPMKNPKDFLKSKGARITLVVKDASQKTYFYTGTLADANEEGIQFLAVKAKENRFFPYADIVQAVRDVRINEEWGKP